SMEQEVKTTASVDSSQESNGMSALASFRTMYPVRPPRSEAIRHTDELRQITPGDGLEEFNLTLGSRAEKSALPRSTPRGNTYLWVIGKNAIPAALETVKIGKSLHTGIIKHTNLTGGADAHCGGEVWFIEADAMVLG